MYSDEDRHDLELLSTTWLIDEFEQSLKSVHNYQTALTHLLTEAPELNNYLRQFVSILTGDFPTWKYNKKIIAEVCCASGCDSFFFFVLALITNVYYDYK